MGNLIDKKVDKELKTKSDSFFKKIESEMRFKSDMSSDALNFDWVDEIENACPFLDIIVRKPKLTLIQEENVVKVEKAKRIMVASIKDLSRHTNYIAEVNKETNDVRPSKILDIRNEETFNIYENRFLYTLINNMNRFILKREDLLKDFELKNNKTLEYVANSKTSNENVSIELKMECTEIPEGNNNQNINKEIKSIQERIKRIREYITSWEHSEMYKALEKAHVPFVIPPIKKTNILLKNPNFKLANNLWDYLQTYDLKDRDNSKDGVENDGDRNLRGFLDHSFLIDYFVMDSISTSKREQKENLAKYAVLMISQEINRTLNLLLNSGVKITDEELLEMIAKSIKDEKENRLVGVEDVKKKFKSAMDEYLERTQDLL